MRFSARRVVVAMLAGALFGGGLSAIPASASAVTLPVTTVTAPTNEPGAGGVSGDDPVSTLDNDCVLVIICGEVQNDTNIYIKVQYSRDGQDHTGYVTPHTSWGADGNDMDFFWIPSGCVFYGVHGDVYTPGKVRGDLEGAGKQIIDRAVCSDGAHLNSDASVAGVAGKPATAGCPAGNFCLYTEANFGGSVYQLYRCQSYKLANWNGVGSWKNNNTGGAQAQILGKTGNQLVNTGPGNTNSTFNWNPAWFVKAC
jgi:hypothetical protein